MDKNFSVSLFIPVYNAQRLIKKNPRIAREALRRLPEGVEMVVIDDNSSDKTYRLGKVINKSKGNIN